MSNGTFAANLTLIKGGGMGGTLGSMPGESNERHVAVAIGLLGLLVVVTGLVNIKVGRAGRS